MNTEQNLRWLVLSGITETVAETPVNRLAKTEPAEPKPLISAVPDQPPPAVEQARALAQSAQTLEALYQNRTSFDGCSLKKTSSHTLNGFGASSPQVLCLLEAPDADEDRSGHLINGPAGDLFRKMIGAIGLDLTQHAYVSTLIPWRPPGNRKPTDVEQAICRPFWEREIQLLKPKLLLLFGSGVSQALLGISALSKARGSWHDYHGIPTRVSIAPATLLKLPAQKKQAWEDLQQVAQKLTEQVTD